MRRNFAGFLSCLGFLTGGCAASGDERGCLWEERGGDFEERGKWGGFSMVEGRVRSKLWRRGSETLGGCNVGVVDGREVRGGSEC